MTLRNRSYMGESSSVDTVEGLMTAIRGVVEKHGLHVLKIRHYDGYGESIFLATTKENDRSKVSHGIWENDHAFQSFYIRGPKGGLSSDGKLSDRLSVEIVQGGSVTTKPPEGSHMALGMAKIGWRKKTGTPAQIVKHLDNYFAKTVSVIKANKDNMPKVWK